MKKVSAVLLVVFFLLPGWVQADEKIRGKYEVIGDINKLKDVKTIKMVEFFNYSCGHCYRFLETSKRLHSKFKDKLHHKKFPIYWGNQTAYPAMAFYIADELGVEEEFTQELFNTSFKLNINIFQPKVIKFLARDFKISKEMTEGMQSASIKAKTDKSLELAKQFKASETPTIIINDILKVAPSMTNGSTDEMTDNLEMIFEDILKRNG
ncbi:MAG: thioredoxin domain-containing protein [Nitrospina sp.]|jgi:protein dithiol oxidoreductase (disulfide-forming)|nr:thioredoxin domain-containing protein [Nitrospina sp.]MBT3416360.1 thioredoxin domain-containing protein [Nitrospina sp.]MBT3856187.1 thioredoxin domain-containing protein [Nitrospina sp.]MBT4105019.1 thioredoxin domain-containing protein [Nitrospina sp.]MBT4389013.1 thioredoxin domain-containing protein [Nitrospina sp.]